MQKTQATQTTPLYEKKYGLFTAITMIVGIVIGSGIFFKSDNILVYTDGSIFLGVLVFIIAAVGIIFGSLTVSELSSKTSGAGGLIAYAQKFIGEKTACSIGWFQTFIYFPVLVSVVSWVMGIYTCILFNFDASLEIQILIGFAYMTFCYVINILSAKFGGYFQNIATIIKVLPLIFIAIGGLFASNPVAPLDFTIHTHNLGQTSWLAALAPIAFSFDGWIVASSIAHEIKNSKRNLPLAYTVAPIFILVIYILYFVGISTLIGPQAIMELGDAHVNYAATQLLGTVGAKLILSFVVISVMGTLNGMILGSIRMPHSLSIRGMFIKSVACRSKKLDTPIKSALIAFFSAVIWTVLNYISQKYRFFGYSDISEGFVVISYAIYIIFYIRVIFLYKDKKIKSVFKGVVCPILATFGSLIILYSGVTGSAFYFFAIVSALVILASLWFHFKYRGKHIQTKT